MISLKEGKGRIRWA